MTRFKRTLIVEQSNNYVDQIKDMLHDLSDSFLCTTNGEEGLALYDKHKPDLVLVEAILPGYDGFALMEHMLPDKDVIKIVLTSMNQKLIISKSFELEAGYVFVKPYVRDVFLKRLLEAADMHERLRTPELLDYDQFLVGRISVALKRLGIPVNLKGYKFLKEALQIVCDDQRKMRPLSANVYGPLARKYSSTEQCVERNIRHAIETAASRGDPDAFYEYFGYSISSDKGKPTNGEFIAALSEKLLAHNE